MSGSCIRSRRRSCGASFPSDPGCERERPYAAAFGAAASHLVILHLSGPVTVRRGLVRSRTIPVGGFFVHPAGRELAVELGGVLDTVHVYLSDQLLQASQESPVELVEELGSVDPLLEQLVLALDMVLRRPEPSARTYADHVAVMLAAQLGRHHAAGARDPATAPPKGLGDRQWAAVRELLADRLAEPVPLAVTSR